MSRHLYKFNTAISPRHPSNRQNNSTTHRHPCVKKFQLTSVVNLALIACLVVACTGLSEGVSLGKQGVKEWEWLNMLLGGPQGSEGGEMDVGSGPDMPVQRSAQFPESFDQAGSFAGDANQPSFLYAKRPFSPPRNLISFPWQPKQVQDTNRNLFNPRQTRVGEFSGDIDPKSLDFEPDRAQVKRKYYGMF
ncbi:uncharacterized protein LOC142349284 isoform X2 [Convolutriloba macropyga]